MILSDNTCFMGAYATHRGGLTALNLISPINATTRAFKLIWMVGYFHRLVGENYLLINCPQICTQIIDSAPANKYERVSDVQ